MGSPKASETLLSLELVAQCKGRTFLSGQVTLSLLSFPPPLGHALPFQRTWVCAQMDTAQGRHWPKTSGTSDNPASFAASGVLCSLALQPAVREGHGSEARKAYFPPNPQSRGGIEVDVKRQKDQDRTANRRKGRMLKEV